MPARSYDMIGGGKCSLCGSPGTNKSTCPLNPKAKSPNPSKHPLASAGDAPDKPAPEPSFPYAMQLKNVPVLESTILSLTDIDTIEALCQSNKEIRKACTDSGEIRAHMRKLRGCSTNQEGLRILQDVSMSMYDQTLDSVSLMVEGDDPTGKDDYQRPLTTKELNTPVTKFCDEAKVVFMDAEGDDRLVTVRASNKRHVSVKDILLAFLDNNKLIVEELRTLNQIPPDEEVELGDSHFFEGIEELGPAHFRMSEFA